MQLICVCLRIADYFYLYFFLSQGCTSKIVFFFLCSIRSRTKQRLAFLFALSFNLFSIVNITRVLSLVCVYKYFSCVCVCVPARWFFLSFFGNTKNKKERETCLQLQTNVRFQHLQRVFDHFILKQKKSREKVTSVCDVSWWWNELPSLGDWNYWREKIARCLATCLFSGTWMTRNFFVVNHWCSPNRIDRFSRPIASWRRVLPCEMCKWTDLSILEIHLFEEPIHCWNGKITLLLP